MVRECVVPGCLFTCNLLHKEERDGDFLPPLAAMPVSSGLCVWTVASSLSVAVST